MARGSRRGKTAGGGWRTRCEFIHDILLLDVLTVEDELFFGFFSPWPAVDCKRDEHQS